MLKALLQVGSSQLRYPARKMEKQNLYSSINHSEIAKIIKNKNLGDIFTIEIPKSYVFLKADLEHINFLLGNTIPVNISKLANNEDFCVFINTNNSMLTIYKDTSNNLSLFAFLEKEIEYILEQYPNAYPLIMNNLIVKLPKIERIKFGTLAIDTRNLPNIVTNFDTIPFTVTKALIQLTQNPKQEIN